MTAFAELKDVFDPNNRMNPGKVVAPYRVDENLRLEALDRGRDTGDRPGTFVRGGVPFGHARTAAEGRGRRTHARPIPDLAELLEHHAPGGWEPELDTDAIVQTHCHQHAVLGFEPDTSLMRRSGVRAEVLDSGCCGLAGNFGFERGHYDISMACAEHALLPAVRQAGQETQVLADGFSCRTQIAHGSDRHAKHLAEILDGQN